MDRRDFLKTMGLLAVTAPAGIAALKQIELEPEIDAAPFADLAESAGEAGGKLGEMAECAQDCYEAFLTLNDGPIPPMPPALREERTVIHRVTPEGVQEYYFTGADWHPGNFTAN